MTILEGIESGFNILDKDTNNVKSVEIENHLSATRPDRRDKVEKILREELSLGHHYRFFYDHL